MARSSYIYIVSDGLGVLAAFTVKYEMINYIRGLDPTGLSVYRVADGRRKSDPYYYDVKELINAQ